MGDSADSGIQLMGKLGAGALLLLVGCFGQNIGIRDVMLGVAPEQPPKTEVANGNSMQELDTKLGNSIRNVDKTLGEFLYKSEQAEFHPQIPGAENKFPQRKPEGPFHEVDQQAGKEISKFRAIDKAIGEGIREMDKKIGEMIHRPILARFATRGEVDEAGQDAINRIPPMSQVRDNLIRVIDDKISSSRINTNPRAIVKQVDAFLMKPEVVGNFVLGFGAIMYAFLGVIALQFFNSLNKHDANFWAGINHGQPLNVFNLPHAVVAVAEMFLSKIKYYSDDIRDDLEKHPHVNQLADLTASATHQVSDKILEEFGEGLGLLEHGLGTVASHVRKTMRPPQPEAKDQTKH